MKISELLDESTGDTQFDNMMSKITSSKLSRNASSRERKQLTKDAESDVEKAIASYMKTQNISREKAIGTIQSHVKFFGLRNFASRNQLDPAKFEAEWKSFDGQ